jgi:hypothetical protein
MKRVVGLKDPASCRSSEPRGFSPGGIFMLAIAMTVASLAAQQAPTAPTGTGLIAGTVVDVTSGLPVSGVEVSLNRAGTRPGPGGSVLATGTGPIPVLTDSQGRFVFSALPEGQYSLGTPPRNGNVPVRGAAVTLAANQRVTDMMLRVGRYGSIAGWVQDDAGDPVVGITVRGFAKRVLPGGLNSLMPRGTAVTDDRGQFRLRGLSVGDYLVCACTRDALPIDKDLLTRMATFAIPVEAVGNQLNESVLTFAPTFHPGNTRIASAQPVTVGHSANVMGISITMQAVTPYRVSGQLTGGGAAPGTSHMMVLFAEGEDPTAIGISELTPVSLMPDGAFSFAGVTPGRYTLEAYPADGKAGLFASLNLTVADREVAGLVLLLSEGATVRGHVEFPGAGRPDSEALTRARVRLVPLEMTIGMMLNIGATGTPGHGAQLTDDGTFTISGVRPGRYVVHAGQFGASWKSIASVLGPDGNSDDGVVQVPDTGIERLTVTMSDTPIGTLKGTVALGKYESPGDVGVFAFPADRARWTMPQSIPGYFDFARALGGAFTFTTLRPGDYYVIALMADEASPTPLNFAEWSKRATLVSLHGGQTTTVNLKR